MNTADVEQLLQETGLDETVRNARTDFLASVLRDVTRDTGQLRLVDEPDSSAVDLSELASALERLALSATADEPDRRRMFADAFACRRAIRVAGDGGSLTHFARLVSDALLAEKPTELAMLLRELPDRAFGVAAGLSWPEELEARSLLAFVLLSRRDRGWRDIEAASAEITRLRDLQSEVEATYLSTTAHPATAAIGLIARYNLARIVDIAASFVTNGNPADALAQIDRHYSNVERLMEVDKDPDLLHTTELVAAGAKSLVRASVWFSTRTLGAQVRAFVNSLAAVGSQSPLLELWPSQREALSRGLLDPARRAIVAEMPTSAGKTLVAEFSIVQALALNPGSTVAYLVPTRALVNQIARRIRRDFAPLGYSVEAAVPVFELDPTESLMLAQPIQVLVTTPEKLDLLIRSEHVVSRDLSLVVADEAHNIGVDARGARLELLLATVKRERPTTRFLLLTPFVPNGDQLARWLSDDANASIRVDWRPSERVTAAAFVTKPRRRAHRVQLLTLPSAHRVDLETEFSVDLGEVPTEPAGGKAGVTSALSQKLAERGGVLVLLNGRGRAEQRAAQIAEQRTEAAPSPLLEAAANLAVAELGADAVLPGLLRRGVSYHHAGLPHELRYLIELLVDQGEVRTVCGTTTLAQGVNFPIASVIVESLQKSVRIRGRQEWQDLTFEEFWNIAGRAGRALRDRVGLVAFPVAETRDIDRIRDYLAQDASEVVSALTDSLRAVTATAQQFNLRLVAEHPAIGIFLQYLAHAARVAGTRVPTDVEDLLRSSLVFHQLQATERTLAERLLSFSRAFLEEATGKSRGYLALADRTGFSMSSVDYLYAATHDAHPEFSEADFWQPDRLFGDDLTGLRDVVSVLAGVPELTLGRANRGPFSADAVAGIVRDWVRGESVTSIADRWFTAEDNPSHRRRDAATYLFSSLTGQVPWGIGALQHLTVGENAPADASHVPFMIYYGVDSEDATRLRMAGVPRPLASGLSREWQRDQPDTPSFAGVRDWIERLPDRAWAQGIGRDSPLTPAQSRLLWREIAGLPSTPTPGGILE